MRNFVLASFLFEFIGAFFKWLFYFVKGRITGEKHLSFKRIWLARNGRSFQERMSQGFGNILLGMVIIVAIVAILKGLGL